MRGAVRTGLVLLLLAATPACASVAPWEREALASPRMALDPDEPGAAMAASRRKTREEGHVAAPGSSSSGGGGGCGCN